MREGEWVLVLAAFGGTGGLVVLHAIRLWGRASALLVVTTPGTEIQWTHLGSESLGPEQQERKDGAADFSQPYQRQRGVCY